jgi:hypothetical protein
LKDALHAVIPPYRSQMIAMDEKGIDMGADAISRGNCERFSVDSYRFAAVTTGGV